MKGNITFVSNLYPVKTNISEDLNFIHQIRDPFCLEKMVKNPLYMNKLSNEQLTIFAQAGGHCEYADKDDYPWGSVILEGGIEKVICKCTKKECSNFRICRQDLFDDK